MECASLAVLTYDKCVVCGKAPSPCPHGKRVLIVEYPYAAGQTIQC